MRELYGQADRKQPLRIRDLFPNGTKVQKGPQKVQILPPSPNCMYIIHLLAFRCPDKENVWLNEVWDIH